MAKTTIEFSEPADRMLEGMTRTLGASKSEVVRNALALYAYLIDQLMSQPDYELAIAQKADDKVVKVVVVPGFVTQMQSKKEVSVARG